jgi:hypothetical protein
MRLSYSFLAIVVLAATILVFVGFDLGSGSSRAAGVAIDPATAPRIPGSLSGTTGTSGAAQMMALEPGSGSGSLFYNDRYRQHSRRVRAGESAPSRKC